ncbi:YbfB/YjiJ family MFS transporter [Inquilinus limosus]|uniref:YbfB/YjiJ family MFS transporter n=1 Tax=Inquilinus limosus TaxID=171674 RepID=UPI000421F278|nr:YbfB/YjiJ family MFS transporter [Inquilinus limosus]
MSSAILPRPVLSALCASLVGIGLARFAYTPLIPPLVAAGWLTPGAAAQLGAANLVGYLAGALCARRLAAPAGPVPPLRGMMLLAAIAFLACAVPLSPLWLLAWRFAAGLAGGAIMVLAAPAVLPGIEPAHRGRAGGLIFAGVGLGIAASGTLVPLLLQAGLEATWAGLGVLALALTALGWGGWPEAVPAAAAAPASVRPPAVALAGLTVEYALNAVGLVPHMVFLVDFVVRGLHRGLAAGAVDWVLFGLGAVAGPVLLGRLADRVGFRIALRLAFLVQAAAVGLPAIANGTVALAASSLIVGAFVPGIVPLVLGQVQALVADPAARDAAWRRATAGFAIGQAAAAYGCSALFAGGSGHALLFALGAAALLLAFVIDIALDRPFRRTHSDADFRTRIRPCPSSPR